MHLLPLIFTILFSVLGGIYFGSFSCGGYAWHKQLFLVALVLAVITSLFFPYLKRSSWLFRSSYLIITVFSFVFFEAFGAALYPSTPESLQNFFKSFLFALEHGSC